MLPNAREDKRLPMKRVAIPFVVHRHKVHHHHVHGMRIEATDAHLKGWKHPTTGFGHNHFGALLMEFVPQLFRFQCDDSMHKRRMITTL